MTTPLTCGLQTKEISNACVVDYMDGGVSQHNVYESQGYTNFHLNMQTLEQIPREVDIKHECRCASVQLADQGAGVMMRHARNENIAITPRLYDCFYHGGKNIYTGGQMTREQFQTALTDDNNSILFSHPHSLLNTCAERY